MNPKQTEINSLMKVSEVAEILNISKAMAYNLVQSGELRSVHIRSARRVRFIDLQKFINENLCSEQ